MNFAMIGCGNMADVYANHLVRSEGMNLTSVYHREQKKADHFAERFGVKGFSNYTAMLENDDIDAVIITLPTFLHKQFVIEAAEHKKHVFCEKPIGLSVAESEEMYAVCASNGVRLFVGHVVRFFPEYVAVRESVVAGEVGKVGIAHARRLAPMPHEDSWYIDEAKSGGLTLDLMIHDLDFLQWTLGPIVTVQTKKAVRKEVQYASVIATFENGAIANVESMWGYPGDFTTHIEIAGSDGLIRNHSATSQPLVLRMGQVEELGKGVEVPAGTSDLDPYYLQLRHMQQCIDQDIPFKIEQEDVLRLMRVAEAVERSVQTNRKQSISL